MGKRRKFPKLFSIFVLSFILFFSFCFLALLFWWEVETSPADKNNSEEILFVVPQGWGANQVAESLRNEKLIKNDLVFKILVFKEGLSRQIQAGDFYLSPSMNAFEIAQQLTRGTFDVPITIPEGLRREEIALILEREINKVAGQFDKTEFIEKTASLEGFLFPDTYLISKDASIDEVIEIFRRNFEDKMSSLSYLSNISYQQIVTLASLIEREAKYESDRYIVSGILIKRLENGWPLQVDAAVQYALGGVNCRDLNNSCNFWPRLKGSDLKFKSSYNTYENLGLPPTPICNPGLSSLKAAVGPQKTNDWFYLSDEYGKMHFSETLDEHNDNIQKYLSD